jgi:antitoxin VapB
VHFPSTRDVIPVGPSLRFERKTAAQESLENFRQNNETYRLVEELAKLTGETLTGAVTQAVRERLDRLRHERRGRLADRLLLIGKDCAARLKEPFGTHAEYDRIDAFTVSQY